MEGGKITMAHLNKTNAGGKNSARGQAIPDAPEKAFSHKPEPDGLPASPVRIGKICLDRLGGPNVAYTNGRATYTPQQLLFLAVIRGDIDAAKAAIRDGACARQKALCWIIAPDSPPGETRYYFSRSETTPLLLAKHMGRTEMMEFLKKTPGCEQHGA